MEELKNVAIWAGCHIAFYTLLSWVTKPSWKQPRADGRLLIATRLHAPTSSQLPSTSKLLSFIESCKSYADHVVVCIGCRNSDGFDDIVQQYRSACGHTATILVIEPWGHFTNALNNCITFAQDNAFDLLGFQSFEYRTTAETINLLRTELCENTLVIGPTIEGHTFELGSHTISGCTSPWNTMAIWNVSVLSLTGFPLIGDGVANRRDIGGIEVKRVNLRWIASGAYCVTYRRYQQLLCFNAYGRMSWPS